MGDFLLFLRLVPWTLIFSVSLCMQVISYLLLAVYLGVQRHASSLLGLLSLASCPR